MSSFREGSQTFSLFSRGTAKTTVNTEEGEVHSHLPKVIAEDYLDTRRTDAKDNIEGEFTVDIGETSGSTQTSGKHSFPDRFVCSEHIIPRVMSGIELSLERLGEIRTAEIPLYYKETQSPRPDALQKRPVPVNLTWIVVFAVTICTISLLFDELFFSHNHLWNHVMHQQENMVDSKASSKNVISILSSGTRQNHALVQGGAVLVFFIILAIWGISAYIKVAYLHSSQGVSARTQRSRALGKADAGATHPPSWQLLLGKQR